MSIQVQADAPKPMPFAIMRNAHEALRASIRLQRQALEAGDRAAFAAEWQRFRTALAVHMAMEDEAMFALLDDASGGAIADAKLGAEHDDDRRLANAVDAVLVANDDVALRRDWTAWQAEHLHHLEHEEQVMMPLTMQTAPTPEGRARIVHERLLTPAARRPDFDTYVGWVVEMLSRYGSNGQPANVATRVFAWGLQHASSREQWARFRPIVQRHTTQAIWDELAGRFGLDGEGRIA